MWIELITSSLVAPVALGLGCLMLDRSRRRAHAARALQAGSSGEELDAATRQDMVQMQRALQRARGELPVGGEVSVSSGPEGGELSGPRS